MAFQLKTKESPTVGVCRIKVPETSQFLDTEDDKFLALEAGADDYLTKPFRLDPDSRSSAWQTVASVGASHVAKAGKEVPLFQEAELLALSDAARKRPGHSRKILQTIGPQYSDEPEYLRLCQDVSQEN